MISSCLDTIPLLSYQDQPADPDQGYGSAHGAAANSRQLWQTGATYQFLSFAFAFKCFFFLFVFLTSFFFQVDTLMYRKRGNVFV